MKTVHSEETKKCIKGVLIATLLILCCVFFCHQIFLKRVEQYRYSPNKREAAKQRASIVIDLNRNGVTTSKEGKHIHFDFDSNGFAESTGWINPQDGFLVVDLNNNGEIDNGRELFGNHTPLKDGTLATNGFEALKEWDSNGDGVISELDEGWSQLKIWRDKPDKPPYGKTDEGELLSLDEIGLKSINLNYNELNFTDLSKNKHTQRGKVEWKDGGSSSAVNVWFKVNSTNAYSLEVIYVSKEVGSLPNIKAFGNVADLHTSMQKNEALFEKVQTFLVSDFSKQRKLLNDLVYEWTGSIDVDPHSRDYSPNAHVMDARQLVALENLMGRPYINIHDGDVEQSNPRPDAAAILIDEYYKFANYFHAALLAENNYWTEFRGMVLHDYYAHGKPFYDNKQFIQTLKTSIENKNLDQARVIVFTAKYLGNYDSLLRGRVENAFAEVSNFGSLHKEAIISLKNDIKNSAKLTVEDIRLPKQTPTKGDDGLHNSQLLR